MPINPYIHFDGNCRAAMEAYHALLGGKLDLMTYDQTPGGVAEGGDRIMHAALMSPHGDLQASDWPPGTQGGPQASVSIHVQLPKVADGRRVYDALIEGGMVKVAFEPSFFSPGFGMCVDRFGTHWIISVTPGG